MDVANGPRSHTALLGGLVRWPEPKVPRRQRWEAASTRWH